MIDGRGSVLVIEDQFLIAELVEEIEALGYGVLGPVTERLTELDVPYAFLSAYARPSLLPEEFDEGSYFKKPLSGGELAAALRALLSPSDA